MKVLMTPEQMDADEPGRERWHALRRGGVTASEIASVMRIEGARPGLTAIYWHKVAGDEIPDAGQMMMGRWLEPFVAERFAAANPSWQMERGPLACHGRRQWQIATPDLLGYNGGPRPVTVQIKTTARWDGYGPAPYGDIPPHYLAQCLWEADVCSAAEARLVVIDRGSGQIRTYIIEIGADERADIEAMREGAQQFRDMVARRRPPEPDYLPDTRGALRRVYAGTVPEAVTTSNALRREYMAARRCLTAAQQRFDRAENRVRAKLRTATDALDADGQLYARRSVYPHSYVSAALVRERHPGVAAECTVMGDQVDKLLPAGSVWKDGDDE
jgi:hypothetical protein